jgi:hypothetical protein
MSDLSQRGKAAPGAPHNLVPMGTDKNPHSSPENASEAAAEEAARAAGSSGDGSRPSRGEPKLGAKRGITARRSYTTARRYNSVTTHASYMYHGYNRARQGRAHGARAPGNSCMAHQVSEWDGRAWREVGLLRRARLSAKPILSPVSPKEYMLGQCSTSRDVLLL